MKHAVFISYSSQNKEAAKAVCHILEQNEIRCWIAPRDIPPGSEYGDFIDDAIKCSKVVVVLFSETAASSVWVKGELNIAFEEQKVIIPFRLDNTPLKGQNRVILNHKHWIDAYPDYKTKFNDLLNAVAYAIGKKNELKFTEVVKPNYRIITKKNILLTSILSLFVVLFYFFFQALSNFIYDKQGMYVNAKGLTSEQKSALSSILDDMVFVEGGSFVMGNTEEMSDFLTGQDSLSRNPHEVCVDNFYICKYEVTQMQWKAFMALDGRCIEDGDKKAMDMLSWKDATAFADTLSSITGLNFSLPTEAQWEYAARGGKKSKSYIFSGNDDPDEVAWTSFDNLSSSHNVGGKRYNELEIYDMTGNVAEWCKDYFEIYTLEKDTNPQGPDNGYNRVLRGGDFRIENFYDMKVSTRYFDSPFVNRKGAGLRLVVNVK